MARNKFDIDEDLETPFNASHLKRSAVYIKKHTNKMVVALLLSSVASIAGLYGPKIMQWATDDAIPQKDVRMLVWLAVAYAGILSIGVLCSTIRSRMMAYVSQDIIFDIREDLFAHLQRLPFSYYDSRPAGKILVRVINYVNSVADMLSNGIINMILECINLIFILIFMFTTNVTLSWVILAGLPLFLPIILLLRPMQRKSWQNQSNKNSNYNAYLAESIDGVHVSQLFSRQEKNRTIMSKLILACRRAWMKAQAITHSVGVSAELLSQIVFTALYIVGVYGMGGGNFVTFGVILAMGQYVSRFWQPITNLANIYSTFVNNIAYLERIFETMDEPVTVDDLPDAATLPPIQGEVVFDHVTFGYEKDIIVLNDVCLTVRAGESIALVGPTGAGKSTIVNLISRFYNVTQGKILLDGHDIAHVTLSSLRSQMGIMMQDSFIFSGTIRDNIRYGRLDATDDEIEAAARAVRAHDFIIEMENGYDTVVNERGSRLSQGQKQLIALARTMLSNPRILILDEATSSIDTHTEKLLQEGIAALLKGRTSFVIAHRLSTIKNSDRILYIGDHNILEAGSHDDLIARRGLYYKLYTAQREQLGVIES